jgi:hypothetical protein
VFSKDDSGGAWGSKKVQVNINDPSETYTLTATATNSEDSATASMDLSWGCNRSPEIAEIILMGNHYIGLEYSVSASAIDPDGDSITYNWSATAGSINNPSSDSIKWTMPGTAGNYEITVTVEDGNGGQAQKTETVEVMNLPSLSLPQIPGGGVVEEGNIAWTDLSVAVGDSINDKSYRGFLSFDISSLTGKEIISAEMKFEHYYTVSDPFSIIEKMWVDAVYWGTDDIKFGDYDIPGVILGEYNVPTFTCSGPKLITAINQAIEDGQDRFQVRLRHKGYKTNHNATPDSIRYGGSQIVEFNVLYIP